MLKKKLAQAIDPAAAEKNPVAKDEKSVEKTDNKPVKKKGSFKDFFARVKKWARELRSEFKKIVWPTKNKVVKNTLVVLAVLAIVAALVSLMDWVFESLILESILKIITGY